MLSYTDVCIHGDANIERRYTMQQQQQQLHLLPNSISSNLGVESKSRGCGDK